MKTVVSRQMWWGMLVCAGVGVLWSAVSDGNAQREPDDKTIALGRMLFEHEWQPNDPLSAEGDGLGPVFNARSCAECHFQGGVGGAGTNQHNVLSFLVHPTRTNPVVREGVVHASAAGPELRESRKSVTELFPSVQTQFDTGCGTVTRTFDPVHFTEINTSPLFGLGLIETIPDSVIRRNARRRGLELIGRELMLDFKGTPAGRPRVLANGRVGKFGWKGQSATLEEFVAHACAVEMGLTNPLRSQDLPRKHVPDENAKLDLDAEQFHALVSFVETLPRPRQVLPTDAVALAEVHQGEALFSAVGCADCHTPNLGGVEGLYSDLLLHRVEDAESSSSSAYSGRFVPEVPFPDEHPVPSEWKTPPLWGVADSAPYFHDGRSPTLRSAILRHAGEAKQVTERFLALPESDQQAVVAFLRTLRAPEVASPTAQHLVARDNR